MILEAMLAAALTAETRVTPARARAGVTYYVRRRRSPETRPTPENTGPRVIRAIPYVQMPDGSVRPAATFDERWWMY